MKTGKRLVTKIFNASKLVIGRVREAGIEPRLLGVADLTHPIDRGALATLLPVVDTATQRFEAFESAVALESVESWFWSVFTDNYLELAKGRAYAGDRSALAGWSCGLSAVLRLFAPFLPFITEEAWEWQFGSGGASVHLSTWPIREEFGIDESEATAFTGAVDVLGQVRKIKSDRSLSIRFEVPVIVVRGPSQRLHALIGAEDDLLAATAAAALRTEVAETEGGALEVVLPE